MNIKLYNAAITQLRGKAMESLAVIDVLLNNPTMVPDHSTLVEEIIKHTRILSENEDAMIALQKYFPSEQTVSEPAASSVSAVEEKEADPPSTMFQTSENGRSKRGKTAEIE